MPMVNGRFVRPETIEKWKSQAADRDAKKAAHAALFDRAWQAGAAAAAACQPDPMIVTERDGTIVARVADGPCGFAWVTVRPGNSSFAIWLKATRRASRDYYSGVSIWISDYGQSMERKRAHAHAMAAVLAAEGIKAYAGSRMD